MMSCHEYNHQEIFLNCSRDETQKIIYNQNRIDVSLIQEGEVIFNKIILNYEFSIKLPKRYEYCGEIPAFMCSEGEPYKYYAVDTTLSEELVIKIEENKSDQKQYDQIFRSKYDSIQKSKSQLDIEKDNSLKQNFIKDMRLASYQDLTRTYCKIEESEFVGFGFNGLSNRGYPCSEYNIYGYKNNVLISVFYRTKGKLNEKLINELYCIINDIKLARKK